MDRRAVDGKHIVTRKPKESGYQFFSYKNFFSAVLRAVAAADYFFYKDLLHRKSVRYTGLQNYEIVPLTNLP